MYRNPRYWFILFLAVMQVSFVPDLKNWWYNRHNFSRRVQLVKSEFQKGVVLPLFGLEQDYPYQESIDEIAALDARSISLFVTNYQEDIRSNSIYLNRRAIEPLQLAEIIDYAHRRGLSVFLFPTLHIQHLAYKEWRGVLQPSDVEEWWQNYFRVIRFYVNIAREHKVEMLSIGSELCSMESHYERWAKIIEYCRAHYSGLLTYSANWDHFRDIPFMKDLDFMGMNLYFDLTDTDDPKLEELLKVWKPAVERVEEAYKEYRKPMLFTELGYPSVDGANRSPWDYFSKGKVDLAEQALCYTAFVRTWDPPPPYLQGVYFYNWWGPGGAADRDYTPRGKPAAAVLRSWYGSL